jgi:DNA uptake protein ComE-like DNA-binding protein
VPTTTATPAPPPAEDAAPGCIDINSAGLADLELIIHIGPARAAEMLTLRPFSSVADMDRIAGIGPSRLADIIAEGLACVP